jgi:hypothetical protein
MNHERCQKLLGDHFRAISSGKASIEPPPRETPKLPGVEGKVTPYPDALCEYVTYWIWGGARENLISDYNLSSLASALEDIQSRLASVKAKPYQKKLLSFYKKLATPSTQGSPRRPADPSLYTLFEGVDAIICSQLLEIYDGMVALNQPIDMYITYIESALAVAKEITRTEETLKNLPPLIERLVPQVETAGVRFSAVMITEEAKTHGDWLEPEREKVFSQRRQFDFYRQEAALYPYNVFEVRAAGAAGPEEIENMLREEIGDFLQKLSTLTVWWYQNRKGDFPFPERLIITYLRGSSPHLFYCMPLNAWFFEQWINALETRRQNLRGSMPKYENPLDLSTTQWTAAMQAEQEIPEIETFMDILIRRWKRVGLREQRAQDKGEEIETWRQWEMP